MGVYIGGLLGPLLTGFVQQEWGFHLGFGLAAIGMAIGLAQYALTRKGLPASVHTVPDPLPRSKYPAWAGVGVATGAAVLVLALGGVISAGDPADLRVGLAVVGAIATLATRFTSKTITADERSRVVAFSPMFIGTAASFALFQQQFTVITLYSDTRLVRVIGGFDLLGLGLLQVPEWQIPIPWGQSFNPFLIIVLAPPFAALPPKPGPRPLARA